MSLITLFFSDLGSDPRPHFAFSCHLSLDSCNLELFLSISLSFTTDIFWSPNHLFCKMFLSLGSCHLTILKDFFHSFVGACLVTGNILGSKNINVNERMISIFNLQSYQRNSCKQIADPMR